MKKLILLCVTFSAIALSSCKKNYVCECEKTRTGSGGSSSSSDGNYTFKDTRARAESRCVEQEGSGSDLLGNYTRDCEIK